MIDQPADIKERVWRYMDFAKFMSILVSGSIFVPRSDMFEDVFEGTLSRATVEKFPKSRPSSTELMCSHNNALLSEVLESQPDMRLRSFISCWHLSNYESAAMWKLYATSHQALAIVSDYQSLTEHMPSNARAGKVTYIDYSEDFIPVGDPLIPFFRKRKSFEHEKEARVVIQADQSDPSNYGINVPFSMKNIVKEIYIAPTAPNWFHETVGKTLKIMNLDIPVHQSGLDLPPLGY